MIELMMALGLVKKVVEKIVLAKKLPTIVYFELIRRFVFSNQRKHYVIIVIVIIDIFHWSLIELSIKYWFLLCTHDRV